MLKFPCTVEIARPIESVASLFLDASRRVRWQDGYLRSELISGTPGEVGARSRLFFSKPRGMELVETIVLKNLPHEITGTYEHRHMGNTMRSRFTAIDENRTRFDAGIHYTQFNGIMTKLMAKFFPGMFRRQVQEWLDRFKELAEET